jgi:hypothetical protein
MSAISFGPAFMVVRFDRTRTCDVMADRSGAMAAFAGALQRIGVGVARDQSGIGTSALFGATGDGAVGAGRGRGSGGDNAAEG